MICKLVECYLGYRKPDDRDNFSNKRIETAGILMGMQFQVAYKLFIKKANDFVKKHISEKNVIPNELNKIFQPNVITQNINHALSTGNWGDKIKKIGITHPLNRMVPNAQISYEEKIVTPIEKSGKHPTPRMLHNTQWNKICPVDTPEGASVGIVKNRSMITQISINNDQTKTISIINNMGTELISKEVYKTKVFVNGRWITNTKNSSNFIDIMKQHKSAGTISTDTSISWNIIDNEIHIYTDHGRCCTPYLTLNDKNIIKITKEHVKKLREGTWKLKDLISNGLIELLDTMEEDNVMIMPYYDTMCPGKNTTYVYTHTEIHPSLSLGICASMIPFPNHNQSPRNTYQCAMGKQAVGVYPTNFIQRTDTEKHVLYYPQKPIISTRLSKEIGFDDYTAGQNAIVAIVSYNGYNQEDSVIMNQYAIDRGMFRHTYYRTYKDEEKQINTNQTRDNKSRTMFEKPTKQFSTGKRDYNKLDIDGIPSPGTTLFSGDPILGKTQIDGIISKNKEVIKRDISTIIQNPQPMIVDTVFLTTNDDGNRIIKIKTRIKKQPNIGDKFSSRHGQKGVLGMTYAQEDMPFTRDGISPDIIINPHALPSRMTVAQILECTLSKAAVMKGKLSDFDGTPFNVDDEGQLKKAYKILKEHGKLLYLIIYVGYHYACNETLYNGQTGRIMTDAKVFIGPTYYQRLRHVAQDKLHFRNIGPVDHITRQPPGGKQRKGGLRFGEMERDCMISYGASAWLKERLFYVSDMYYVYVCEICGLFAIGNKVMRSYKCNVCAKKMMQSDQIVQVEIPYACKLLFQELMALSIQPRLILK